VVRRNWAGQTHKLAFLVFEQLFPNSPLLSQTIDARSPLDWFISRREDANYNIARFLEPNESPNFAYLEKNGVRKLCVEYLRDDSFAFDPDHAVMAYPLFMLKHISNMGVKGNSCIQSARENDAYEAYFCDRFGQLQPMLDLKNAIVLLMKKGEIRPLESNSNSGR
jgi:hypothetical protein